MTVKHNPFRNLFHKTPASAPEETPSENQENSPSIPEKWEKGLRIFKWVCGSLWYGSAALLTILLVIILSAKLQGQVPMIFHHTLLRVTTGSMEPAIPSGTYVLVKSVPPDQIREGDIITFYTDDPLIQGMPNTHRVLAISAGEAGEILFTTKGDGNLIRDKLPARGSRLIGRCERNLYELTRLTDFFASKGVLLILAALILLSAAMMSISLHRLKADVTEKTKGEEPNGPKQ